MSPPKGWTRASRPAQISNCNTVACSSPKKHNHRHQGWFGPCRRGCRRSTRRPRLPTPDRSTHRPPRLIRATGEQVPCAAKAADGALPGRVPRRTGSCNQPMSPGPTSPVLPLGLEVCAHVLGRNRPRWVRGPLEVMGSCFLKVARRALPNRPLMLDRHSCHTSATHEALQATDLRKPPDQ